MSVNFSKVTPCGGNCDGCEHLKSGECRGCRETAGECVKMWQDGCQIFKCCLEHNALFCGLCNEFPCKWIINKIVEWDKDGIEKLKTLGSEYREVMNQNE